MTTMIHHFGDSYTTVNDHLTQKPKENFVEIVSKNLNFQYSNYGYCGGSNEMILNILLNRFLDIGMKQILFFNFSFLTRGTFYDEISKKIDATNSLYHEIYDLKYFEKAEGNPKLLLLIDYYINYHKDYNFRLFKIIDGVFNILIKEKKCRIFYIHIDDMEYIDDLLVHGTNIKFERGFGNWLKANNFHNEEEGHYSKNIQKILSDIITFKTDNLFSEKNCYISIEETKKYL